jgi:hypothetical protein
VSGYDRRARSACEAAGGNGRTASSNQQRVDATMSNDFEDLLRDWGPQKLSKKATREVADAAYACLTWFRAYAPKMPITGADVVAMVALVLQREREIEERMGKTR